MPTSHYAFRALALTDQLQAIWDEGTFIMTRYEEEDAINLYHMAGGFFAETYFDQFENNLYRTNAFVRGPKVDDYLVYVQLPPGLL